MKLAVTPAVFVIGRCSLPQRLIKKGAFPDFGEHVLHAQKSLKKSKGTRLVIYGSKTCQHGIVAGVPANSDFQRNTNII